MGGERKAHSRTSARLPGRTWEKVLVFVVGREGERGNAYYANEFVKHDVCVVWLRKDV